MATVITAPSMAAGMVLGNFPAAKLGVSVTMDPAPVILAAQMSKLGLDIRSFKVPLKRSVQQVMAPSFRTNFDVGGRPTWAELSEFTLEMRAEQGYGPGPILVRSGLLKQVAGQLNIWTITTDTAFVSNLGRAPYGAIHQSGGGAGSFGSVAGDLLQGEIPARPWALIQDEDVNKIEDVFVGWFGERLLAAGFVVSAV